MAQLTISTGDVRELEIDFQRRDCINREDRGAVNLLHRCPRLVPVVALKLTWCAEASDSAPVFLKERQRVLVPKEETSLKTANVCLSRNQQRCRSCGLSTYSCSVTTKELGRVADRSMVSTPISYSTNLSTKI